MKLKFNDVSCLSKSKCQRHYILMRGFSYTILHKSMASNELIAHVINLKYQYAMPLYSLDLKNKSIIDLINHK